MESKSPIDVTLSSDVIVEEGNSEMDSLRNENAKLKEQLMQLEEKQKSLVDYDSYEARINELEKENAELKDKLTQHSAATNSEEIQEVENETQNRINELEETVNDLKETIETYQQRNLPPSKRRGLALGLTPQQAVIFGKWLSKKLGIEYENEKKELAPLLNSIFGWGISSISNKLPYSPEEDKKYIATLFAPFSEDVAKDIYEKWGEDIPDCKEDTSQE